jgi:hypothetical protein
MSALNQEKRAGELRPISPISYKSQNLKNNQTSNYVKTALQLDSFKTPKYNLDSSTQYFSPQYIAKQRIPSGLFSP